MRIKAVRASNSDSGGRRRRRGGTKWGGESWEGGGEPLMMSLYTSLYLGFKEMQESWSGREESPRAAVARRLAVSIKTREGTGATQIPSWSQIRLVGTKRESKDDTKCLMEARSSMAPKTSTFFDLKTCLGKSYRHSRPPPHTMCPTAFLAPTLTAKTCFICTQPQNA